jgi:8-oxo-dGTP pyrophosphatase MutT (NUDIX family)
VDPGDDQRAARWFGSAAEAHRAAAVRELAEEVGLHLTAQGLGPGSLDDVDAAPPRAELLRELCHWVAPPDVPVRFDARYFVVEAAPDLRPVPDGREAIEAWWTSPEALLREWDTGGPKLYWPTWYTVTQLATCRSASDLLAFAFTTRDPTREEEATLPRHVMENEP